MRVTIVTDASVCGQTGVAGYGFWIVSDRGRHGGSGVFREPLSGSMAGEMMAVVNAVHIAVSVGLAQAGDQVLVQTDCIGAIAHLSGTLRHPNSVASKRYAPIRAKMLDLMARHSLIVTYRHVKGHTRDPAKRSMAQRTADKNARTAQRRAIRARKKEGA